MFLLKFRYVLNHWYSPLRRAQANCEHEEYIGLHATSFAGVAFQMCTNDATIYIKLVKIDIIYVTN